jgi:hypothetical protein
MKGFKRILIFVFILAWLMLEANPLVAQGPYSILTGKVTGIRSRLWLDVESETDKAVVNFRIGHKTVYIPHRYPNPGERVKWNIWYNEEFPWHSQSTSWKVKSRG